MSNQYNNDNDYGAGVGILTLSSLGTPVQLGLADKIYDEIELKVENELERRPFTSHFSQQQYSTTHRDSMPENNDPSSTDNEVHAGPSNTYRFQSGSTDSSIAESTFTSPSAIWRKSRTISNETDEDAATAAQLRQHNLLFARNSELSRWQLESIGDLRRSETQFNNLLLRVQADEGNNYKKLKQEFRELQGDLIGQHGYMIQELNMCATKELAAFSGTFGLCVKTGVALEKLRQKKKKLNISFLTDVAKKLRPKQHYYD
ncbi:1779_t:CDS:1 [Ambispora gerdemannii]|uniref:1779_t:CDS:1 n=1 Tax=Ambispora gerdemannii TaxID=144530 RepID=A0A9N9FRV1_9GLOM|nr:1779_t:CDS:1 [Ambispora gerdemannii]